MEGRHGDTMIGKATLAVVLIAGGKSTRMGRDKAGLLDRTGRELWKGRLELLQELKPMEVLISCREDQEYLAQSGARLVFDQWEDAGPLGGIVGCLEAMESQRLLVLAVDLPGMTRLGLEMLLAEAEAGEYACPPPPAKRAVDARPLLSGGTRTGALFQHAGFLEPLAAVYPKWMSECGRRRLGRGEFALRDWIAEAGEAMRIVEAPARWPGLLVNVNDPAAWDRWMSGMC